MSVVDNITAANGVWLYREDVREALRNPTDKQVRAIADRVECSCESGYAVTCPIHGASEWMVRAVLAAAAGGQR